MRLLSCANRLRIGLTAIAKNSKHLRAFHKANGGSWWKTCLEARKTAKAANVKADFFRALRQEGIPKELMPSLIITDLQPTLPAVYISEFHTVAISSRSLNIVPSFILGKRVCHEVKHSGQALALAKGGGAVPLIPNQWLKLFHEGHLTTKTCPVEFTNYIFKHQNGIPFLPEDIWNLARNHPKLRVRTAIPQQEIWSRFEEAAKLGRNYRNLFTKDGLTEHIGEYAARKGIISRIECAVKKVEENTSKSSVGRLTFRDLVREFGDLLRPLQLVSSTIVGGVVHWFKELFVIKRKLVSCPIEREAIRAQRLYIGMPRIHTPSLHLFPYLAPFYNYDFNQINQAENVNAERRKEEKINIVA